MAVRLSIEIVSPLEPDDRDLLTGLSIMVMAIANNELAKQKFPGTFPSADELNQEEQEEMPCAAPGRGADEGKYCVNVVGHKGRHRLRFILPPADGVN